MLDGGQISRTSVTIPASLSRTSSSAASKADVTPDGRIPALDGIRGIAVLMVMVFHFWVNATMPGTALWERAYAGVAGMGWAGVDLFFVLSGFLITGILYDARGSRNYYQVFYGRRTVRIFPLYYASLILFFWLIPFALSHMHRLDVPGVHNTALAKFFSWTYLINWYEGAKGFNVISLPLQHFWSLAIEEQFYLVWPFLVLTLGRRRLMGFCFGLMAFGLASRAVLYGLHHPYAAYTWTFCRADSLAIGAFVALAARNTSDWKVLVKWARYLAIPAICAVILIRVLNPLCTTGPGSSPTFFMGTFEISLLGIFYGSCLAMAVGLRREDAMHRILGSSFLRFFGKYSYCLYVCHLPLIVFFGKLGLNSDHLVHKLHSELLAVLAVNGIAFTLSIAVALVSWNLYEKQWLKLKDLPILRREEAVATGQKLAATY